MPERITPEEAQVRESFQLESIRGYLNTLQSVATSLDPRNKRPRFHIRRRPSVKDLFQPAALLGVDFGLSTEEAEIFTGALVAASLSKILDEGDRITTEGGQTSPARTADFKGETNDVKMDMWRDLEQRVTTLTDHTRQTVPSANKEKVQRLYETAKTVGRDAGYFMHQKTVADISSIHAYLLGGAAKIASARLRAFPREQR